MYCGKILIRIPDIIRRILVGHNGDSSSRQRSNLRSRTEASVKRLKLTFCHQRGWGQLLSVGQGDTGQLGLGEDVMEKMRLAPVPEMSEAVDAVAGGMHTAVLDRFLKL